MIPDSVGNFGARPRARFGELTTLSASDVYYFLKPLVFLIILWEAIVRLQLVSRHALPPITEVVNAFVELTTEGRLIELAQLTLFRAISALMIAIVIGILIGIAMARIKACNWFFDPLVSIGFPTPKATLVPVYLIWFGFGTPSTIALATTAAIFPVIIATNSGVRGVEKELLWSAHSMGSSGVSNVWKVILPAAAPQIFNGIQIAVFLSFALTLVAEMVTSGGGLGAALVLSIRFHQPGEALCFLFVAITLGVVTDRIFRVVRAYLLRWQ